MGQNLPPHFVEAVGHNIEYWSTKIGSQTSNPNQPYILFHDEILHAVQFGASITKTTLAAANLFIEFFSVIEKHSLDGTWLPTLKQLKASAVVKSRPSKWHKLRLHYATFLRLQHQFHLATEELESLLGTNIAEPLHGIILLELSECKRPQGIHLQAIDYANRALNYFSRVNNIKWQAAALNNLGILYTDTQDYIAAETHLTRALEFETSLDNKYQASIVQLNLGRLYQQRSFFWKAIHAYTQAQQLTLDTSNHNNKILLLNNIAASYIELNLFDIALGKLHEAAGYIQNGNQAPNLQALIDLNIGAAFAGQHNYKLAIEHYQRSMQVWLNLRRFPPAIRTSINIGNAYSNLGQQEVALTYYHNAQKIIDEMESSIGIDTLVEELNGKLS